MILDQRALVRAVPLHALVRHDAFGSYRLGLELLMINGMLVFAGLYAISLRHQGRHAMQSA